MPESAVEGLSHSMDVPVVLNEQDDSKSLGSTLLGRYHFSRSFCHRLDTRLPPLLISSPSIKTSLDANNQEGFISSDRACFAQKTSATSPPKSSRESSHCSSSPVSSPKHKHSSSKLSFEDSDENLHHSMKEEEGKKTNIGRGVSWSEDFDNCGGAKAVQAAEGWMVDISELFLGHKFASGTHSHLYHGIYKGSEVAVKLTRKPNEDEEIAERLEREFVQEVTLLSRLHHPNVVQFVAACRKPPVCCIVTKYLPNGSLRAFLHKNEPHSLPLKIILGMALDIARGMEYVHSQEVIHRDLKSENLCLEKDLVVKVTDFGVACLASECHKSKKDIGTYRWMAPEMISHKLYSRKVDVYSFGIILWEIYTCLTPFEEMSAVQAAFAVVDKHARPEIPLNCPHVLSDLMKHCWAGNPDKRPEFWQIVRKLEQFEDSSKQDMSFSTWQCPSHRTNLFLRCFTGCA